MSIKLFQLYILVVIMGFMGYVMLKYIVKFIYACIKLPIKHRKIIKNCTDRVTGEIIGETYKIVGEQYFYNIVYKYNYNNKEYNAISKINTSLPLLHEDNINIGDTVELYVNPSKCEDCYTKEEIKRHTKSVMIDILSDIDDWADLRI